MRMIICFYGNPLQDYLRIHFDQVLASLNLFRPHTKDSKN
jgi:hypothetical protein